MRLMRSFALLVALAAGSSIGGVAWGQSIYGPGGLLLNPTADMPARGQITPAFLWIRQQARQIGGRRAWVSYALDYGLTDRLEIGVTHLKVNPGDVAFKDGSTGGFAKYRLIEGKPGGRPDVAVGASFLGGGDVNAKVGFAAARFTPANPDPRHPMHLHFGLMYASELNGLTRTDLVPYGGIDYGITRELIGFAEIRALMDAKPHGAADLKPPTAVGLVWRPARYLKIAVGYANNGWSHNFQPAFGVGYTIGTSR